MLHSVTTLIATLVVGRIPKAPGTWGSALAVGLWLLLMPENPAIRWVAIISAFFLGWWATQQYERLSQKHDPKEVVIDELVGMWMVLACLPSQSGFRVFIAFLLFRLFDIWKPFPIGWVDRQVPGALGTMLDDVVAGVFGAGVLLVLLQLGALDKL